MICRFGNSRSNFLRKTPLPLYPFLSMADLGRMVALDLPTSWTMATGEVDNLKAVAGVFDWVFRPLVSR
jgi:hypothetical protein